MPKVVVIGRRADILPFRAVGAELVEVVDTEQAGEALNAFRQSTEPVLVMMTEELVNACGNGVAEFRQNRMNVLLPIPTIGSEPGGRLERMRQLVARAIGVDLLGRKE
jgi:vacuolar-type H+-ATPase subunit F/Vma7